MNKIKPEIGMGATLQIGSDSYPYTIISIVNDKKIIIQEDKSIRIDDNGMSDQQIYKYEQDIDGLTDKASLRKDGHFHLIGRQSIVHIGNRRRYYDFSY